MKDKFNSIPVAEKLVKPYDSMEFTLASGLSDYDVKANVTGAFENLTYYTTLNIRTDQNITIKFNSTSYRVVTINSNRPFELDNLMEIHNFYITNTSGSTANIKIIATKKGD